MLDPRLLESGAAVVVVVVVEPGKMAGNTAAPIAPIAIPMGKAIDSN